MYKICVISAQGYGFLSENATFVDICKDHGIEFIGPTSDHINIMGDKSTARDTMKVLPALPLLRYSLLQCCDAEALVVQRRWPTLQTVRCIKPGQDLLSLQSTS